MKSIYLFVIVAFLFCNAANAKTYQGHGSNPGTSYVVYIPDKLDMKKKHPWILGLSPDGDGMQALAAMKEGCDTNGWILVASNNSKNGLDWNILDSFIFDTMNSALGTLPLDSTKMYVGGLSGGAMVSHWLVAKYPKLIRGAVINCGMMNEDLQKQLGYPSGKAIVFMTNPQDFRYKEICANYKYVISRGCRAYWMEFPGGHAWAPPKYYSAAFKWLDQQAKLNK